MVELARHEGAAVVAQDPVLLEELAADPLLEVHPRARLARKGLGHERRPEAGRGCDAVDDALCQHQGVCQGDGGMGSQVELVLTGPGLEMATVHVDAEGGELIRGFPHEGDADAVGLVEVPRPVDGAGPVEEVELHLRPGGVARRQLTQVVDHALQGGPRVAKPGQPVGRHHVADRPADAIVDAAQREGVGLQPHVLLHQAGATLERRAVEGHAAFDRVEEEAGGHLERMAATEHVDEGQPHPREAVEDLAPVGTAVGRRAPARLGGHLAAPPPERAPGRCRPMGEDSDHCHGDVVGGIALQG